MTRPRIENVIVDWSKTGDLRSTSKWFRRPPPPKLPPAVLLEATMRGKAEIGVPNMPWLGNGWSRRIQNYAAIPRLLPGRIFFGP